MTRVVDLDGTGNPNSAYQGRRGNEFSIIFAQRSFGIDRGYGLAPTNAFMIVVNETCQAWTPVFVEFPEPDA